MTSNDCRQTMKQIAPAVIGELDSSARRQLEDHIAQCSDCARETHRLSQTLRSLSSLEELPVPRPFFIDQPEGNRFGSWLLRLTLRQRAALAASVLLLLTTIVLAAADFRVRLEDRVATIGFGPLPTLSRSETGSSDDSFERAVARAQNERLAHYQQLRVALEEQVARNLASSEENFGRLLETALASQRREIQQDLLAYAAQVESGVEGYVLGTWNGLSRSYAADLEGMADLLDGWALRSAVQEQRVADLAFAVLELGNSSAATNDNPRRFSP